MPFATSSSDTACSRPLAAEHMVVVFADGVDGAGKTTLLNLLSESLHQACLAPPLWQYLQPIASPDAFPGWVTTTEPARVAVELLQAHPHGRGEDGADGGDAGVDAGAPPRAWGGPNEIAAAVDLIRRTPTGVGRTPAHTPHRTPPAAHPHGRGEDTVTRRSSTSNGGAPPRAWGGLHLDPERPHPGRRTPTGVGRTAWPTATRSSDAAHPHGRGEDSPHARTSACACGAPPRAWGGRPNATMLLALLRRTPTGVGRTMPAVIA